MAYAKPDGMTSADMELELLRVFARYPEYHERGFKVMVERFAGDNFYHLHLVAGEYVKCPYFAEFKIAD